MFYLSLECIFETYEQIFAHLQIVVPWFGISPKIIHQHWYVRIVGVIFLPWNPKNKRPDIVSANFQEAVFTHVSKSVGNISKKSYLLEQENIQSKNFNLSRNGISISFRRINVYKMSFSILF